MVWKILGLTFLSCLVSAVCLLGLFALSLPRRNMIPLAIYDHMYANVLDDGVSSICVGRNVGHLVKPAQLYLRMGESRVVRVMELTLEDIEQLSLSRNEFPEPDGTKSLFYSDDTTAVDFRDGRIEGACFRRGSPMDLAPTPNGPWFRLPISQKRLIELFGEPVRWSKRPSLAP